MLAKLRPRLTYANVMATFAAFVALSTGGAYAADTIGSSDVINESLLSEDIKNGEVKSPDILNQAVIRPKISNGAVDGIKLANGAITSDKVADGGIQDVDVKNNILTGAQIDENTLFNDNSLTGDDISNSSTLGGNEINESTLHEVASAVKVGNGSLDRIGFNASNGGGGGGGGSIGGGGGLGVTYSCAGATGDLSLSLSTAVDNASLAVSDDDSYFDVEDFDVADGDVDILTPLGGDSDEIINFVYVDGSGSGIHKVVNGQLHVLDQAPAGTQSECVVAGHAILTVL